MPLGRPINNVHVVRRRRAPDAGAAGRPRPDRLLRDLRRPRVRQRPGAHPPDLLRPTRSARASGSAGPATTAAGCRTARWTSSAAGTTRSRSEASGSRSARSRTPCCGCPASATAQRWSPRGPTGASTSWPSTPARGHSTATSCGSGWSRGCPSTWSRRSFHWRESLPLTANGKIDRTTLTALAGELGAGEEAYDAPRTPTEQRLAAAWAKVLGVPQDQIGRRDHFFDRGGTSLSAVKLAIALNRAVSLKDVTRHPVLEDLAGMVDGRSERRSGPVAVPVGTGRCAGGCPGVLPLRRRQRGELPADGRRTAWQRAGGPRRGAARSRRGCRARAVRADGAGGRPGRRRDHRARPDQDPAVGPLRRHRVRRGDGQEAAGARGGRAAGVPRRAAAR